MVGGRHRARLAWLAVLSVAAAAYGSFVPLRWRPIGWVEGLRLAAEVPVEPVWHVFNGDFFTNVLVFLPIGFFAAGALWPRSRREGGATRRAALQVTTTVLVGSAVLSALIELGQVYLGDRTPSWSDVYAQAFGGLVGAVLWVFAGNAAIQWVAGSLRASSREDRVLRLLGLYAAGWAIYSLLPLFFPRLAHPDLYLWTAGQNLTRLVLAGPVLVAGLSAVPVGAIGALLGARAGRPWIAVLLAAAGIALLVFGDRVRQVSIMPADGHLAAGLLGYACGWLLPSLRQVGLSAWEPGRARWKPVVALTAWLALVVLHYWAPFDFGVSAQAWDQRVAVLYTRAPFHRYYWLPSLVALGEVITLLLLALGASALISLAGASHRRVLSTRATVLLTTLAFAVVEWGQLYLPSRRADPTDVLIAIAGACMGTVVTRAIASSPPTPRGDTTSSSRSRGCLA